jgi:hypothetical protein
VGEIDQFAGIENGHWDHAMVSGPLDLSAYDRFKAEIAVFDSFSFYVDGPAIASNGVP